MKNKFLSSIILLGAALTAHGQYATTGIYDSPSNPNVVDFDESIAPSSLPLISTFMPFIWASDIGGTIDFDTPSAPTTPVNSFLATYGVSQSKFLQVSFVDPVQRVFLNQAISGASALRSLNPTNMVTYYGPGLRQCGFTILSDPTTSFWAVVIFTKAGGGTDMNWAFIPAGATVGDTYFSDLVPAGDSIIKSQILTFGMSTTGQLIIDDLSFIED